eukprot:73024_1
MTNNKNRKKLYKMSDYKKIRGNNINLKEIRYNPLNNNKNSNIPNNFRIRYTLEKEEKFDTYKKRNKILKTKAPRIIKDNRITNYFYQKKNNNNNNKKIIINKKDEIEEIEPEQE